MANKLYEESNIQAIANAIRAKGQPGTMTVAQMPSKIAGIKTKSTYTWHQCPTAVKDYLANVTYNPSDYTTSQIANYAPATPAVSNTKPIGKTIDGVTYYNEVPNVETPFSSANEAGTIKPLDSLRWIKSYGSNMRDLGGWPCDGGTIKYGRIYRSADIFAQDADLFIKDLGITMEIDLTSDGNPAPFDGMEFVCADSYAMYSLTPASAWRTNLRALFDAIKQGRAVDFHCSMGADRTGTFACIVEGLLGVSQSDCDKDYELTSFYSLRARNGNYQGAATWAGLMSQISALNGATFRDKIVNFVASLGFTAEEINEFRKAMIDGTPADVTPSIATYTITKNGGNVSFDNSAESVNQYQGYETNIVPEPGYKITGITVTMGGVDVTGQYFRGEEVPYGVEQIIANGEYDITWKSKVNVNVPQGITPSGTKTITENGTYDVASFASAAVNVPSGAANCKRFTLNVTAAKASSQYTIVTGDTDVAAHYADNTAFAVFFKNYPRTDTVGLVASICGNMPVSPADTTSHIIYGNTTESAINASHVAGELKTEGTQAGKITAYANGDLKIYSQSSNNVIRNGTYTVLFCW